MEKHFIRSYHSMLLIGIAALCIAVGCSKTGLFEEDAGQNNKVAAYSFYNVPPATDATVKAIAASLQRQDAEGNIEARLTGRAGVPKWDKSLMASREIAHGRRGESGISDSMTVVLVPFVREGAHQTNAMLRVSISFGDTTYQLIYAGQYAEFGFDNGGSERWNAKDIFHLFTVFDREIFGHRKFRVSDSKLLGDAATDADKMHVVEFSDRKSASKSIMDTYCNYYDYCRKRVPCVPEATAGKLSARPVTESMCCIEWGTFSECTSIFVEFPGDGSGGPAPLLPGDGSFGGVTGGQIIDPCDGKTSGRMIIPTPGTPLYPPCYKDIPWEPVDLPEVSEPIDSLLKNAAQLVNKYRDSLAVLCETEHKERFFNIVNYGNQLDTFRVLTGATDDEVKPNYYMTGGRISKGSWHYHPKYSDGTPGSWPSGGDVAQLYDKPEGFVMIIDADNARYALVVENAVAMNTWKNIFGNGPKAFPDKVYNSVLADSRVWSTGSDYIQMTKEKLMTALGQSNVSGIALYQASSKSGTSFNKIN